jgi:hypothetical protein
LKAFLEELLQDEKVWGEFQKHPAIHELADKQRSTFRGKIDDFPSYIPEKTFALVFANLTLKMPANCEGAIEIKAELDQDLRTLVDTILTGVRNSPAHALDRIQTWYSESLQRITGRYVRQASATALLIAIGLTVGFNIDSVHIATALKADQNLRDQLSAKAVNASAATLQMNDLHLPIGWNVNPFRDKVPGNWWVRIAGWAISVFAIQLGAPFWFDLLSRFTRIRQAESPRQRQ